MNKEIHITTRDRLLRAWENSMEMVRDLECYAKETQEQDVEEMFRRYAEEASLQASAFRSKLLEFENQHGGRHFTS